MGNEFICPKCKKEKNWEEAPLCNNCGWDETFEKKEKRLSDDLEEEIARLRDVL